MHHILWKCAVEQVVNLSLDVSASIPEDMQKGFMLAMNVGNEVFCTFRKAENCLEVNDFRACTLAIGKCLGEELQQTHIGIVSHILFNSFAPSSRNFPKH